MTIQDALIALQRLPRGAELLAFEPGCEEYCERQIDEVQWQGGQVYLHLDPPRRPTVSELLAVRRPAGAGLAVRSRPGRGRSAAEDADGSQQ